MHGNRRIALNADRAAQAINRQAPDQIFGRIRLAVEQDIVAICPDDEVEQALALRRQQPGPDRQMPFDVACHQSLEEAADILAGKPDDRTVGEGGGGHAP